MSRNPCRFLRSEIDRVLQSAKKAGASLTAQSVADIVKIYAERVGLDPALFAGHSMRSVSRGARWVGHGTGVDDSGLGRKCAAVEAALCRHCAILADPLAVAASLGGRELAATRGTDIIRFPCCSMDSSRRWPSFRFRSIGRSRPPGSAAWLA